MSEYLVELHQEKRTVIRGGRFENLMKCSTQYKFTERQKAVYTNLLNSYKNIHNISSITNVGENDLTESLLG